MPTPELRPPADHESADVRVVAPVNAGQQGDTSIDAFQRWLETAAHEAHFAYENPPADLSGQDLRLHLEGCEIALLDCRAATRLLMAFKLERLA